MGGKENGLGRVRGDVRKKKEAIELGVGKRGKDCNPGKKGRRRKLEFELANWGGKRGGIHRLGRRGVEVEHAV